MNGAITPLLNALLQGDMDCGNHQLKNLDTSNLGLGSFGPQVAHSVFAGPASGGNAVPSFRILTPSEIGAEPHTTGLTTLSTVSPTTAGLNLLRLTNPASTGFVKIGNDLDVMVSTRTPAQLLGDINAEPHTAGLTALAGLTPTLTGKNLLVLTNPSQTGFVKIGNDIDNTVSVRTPAQMISDLGIVAAPFIDSTAIIRGSADATKLFRIEVDGFTTGNTRVMTPPNYDFTPASIAGAESLLLKNINGLTLAVGTSPGPTALDAITYTQTPANPFQLALIGYGVTGLTGVIRAGGSFDVVMPLTGQLATAAGTIPFSYLDTDKELAGSGASDAKVASQKAVHQFVYAHTGGGIQPADDATVASATTVDLSGTVGYQIGVTGTTPIEAFTLNAGQERVAVFTGSLTLVASANLLNPGGRDIPIAAGDYIVVRGNGSGVSTILKVQKLSEAPNSTVADIVGGRINHLESLSFRGFNGASDFDIIFRNEEVGLSADRNLTFFLNDGDRLISLFQSLSIQGTNTATLVTTGVTNATLPTGTTTMEGRVAAPANASSSGVTGQVAFDATHEYRCISTNTWVRVATATW